MATQSLSLQGTSGAPLPAIMRVLLCDCTAALELSGGALLMDAHAWRVKLAVTNLLHERELRGSATMRGAPFRIESLPPETLQRAMSLRRLQPHLSLCDACAVTLAAQRAWVLLTLNAALARTAMQLRVETRDVDWLRSELQCFAERATHGPASRRLSPSIGDVRARYGGFEPTSA